MKRPAPQTPNREVRPRAAESVSGEGISAYRDFVKELVRQFPDEGPSDILARLQRTGVRLSKKQQTEIMRLVEALEEAEWIELGDAGA